jgi:predicted Zn-dependent protease
VPEVTVACLDVWQQKLVENAHLALERGQFDYVLGVCAQILTAAPGCLPVRRLQRSAQLRRFRTQKLRLGRKAVANVTALFFRTDKNNPGKTLEHAEQWLARAPTSVPALRLLADAAARLDLPQTAAFALAAIRELQPGNQANLLALGEAWLTSGQPAVAISVADFMLAARPGDAGALNLLRKASVAQAVGQGSWESPATFRDKLRR